MADLYGSDAARSLSLEALVGSMEAAGCTHVYFKRLAPNDNSKNQPYFGSDFSILRTFPGGEITEEIPSSRKHSLKPSDRRLKSSLEFEWLGPDRRTFKAPNAKLILYPQFPEVRLSGFMRGSAADISEWMQPGKSGRAAGRVLVMGVKPSGQLLAWLAVPGSSIARALTEIDGVRNTGVFSEIPLGRQPADNRRTLLLRELRRIHLLGWIEGKRLDGAGHVIPYDRPNGAGYTLEAELGVRPNGRAEPDYLGWEIKQYGVSTFERMQSRPLTLMTPEPSGGYYEMHGARAFVMKYGYPDRHGRRDRMNFGGVHKVGERHPVTGLTLELRGVNVKTGAFDADGGLALSADNGELAALWHFRKLLDHWVRKHNLAAFIPSMKHDSEPRRYVYGHRVGIGEGTEFRNFLQALQGATIYYDPGIKVTEAGTPHPRVKARCQFRVSTANLELLYGSYSTVDVLQF